MLRVYRHTVEPRSAYNIVPEYLLVHGLPQFDSPEASSQVARFVNFVITEAERSEE